jgi:hypothetical protein
VGRYLGKYSFERSRRYEDNITLDVRENGCEGVKQLKLAYSFAGWYALSPCGAEPLDSATRVNFLVSLTGNNRKYISFY